MSTLDEFDWKLLAALQEDGRLTNQELGDRIGLSPSQCSRRRSRLEEEGFVLGYHARIDRLKTGYNLTVFIHVGMNSHTPDNAAHLKRLVNRLPQVEEAYSLTGDMDYQLKLKLKNNWVLKLKVKFQSLELQSTMQLAGSQFLPIKTFGKK